ncbi:hypothetical protein ACTXT7_016756, partial [Hymenolepis weldensis]
MRNLPEILWEDLWNIQNEGRVDRRREFSELYYFQAKEGQRHPGQYREDSFPGLIMLLRTGVRDDSNDAL